MSSRKITLGLLFLNLLIISKLQGQVGIGTPTPDPSAILELSSTSQGFLLPRMDVTQYTAIPSPATGLMIYNTTASGVYVYDGSSWNPVSGAGDNWGTQTVNIGTGLQGDGAGTPLQIIPAGTVGDVLMWDGGWLTTAVGGDIGGIYNNLTVEALQNRPVAATPPNTSDFLRWDGNAWAPDPGYAAGTGIGITGNTVSALNTSAIWNADQLQGNPVNLGTLNNGEVLTYQSGQWVNQAPPSSPWQTVAFGINYPIGGNVGIGDPAPIYKLSVNGDLKLANGTNVDNITDVMPVTPDNNTLLTAAAINNAIADSTLWDASGASVFYNNGNVGIGTSSPSHTLEIQGAPINTAVLIQKADALTSDIALTVTAQHSDPLATNTAFSAKAGTGLNNTAVAANANAPNPATEAIGVEVNVSGDPAADVAGIRINSSQTALQIQTGTIEQEVDVNGTSALLRNASITPFTFPAGRSALDLEAGSNGPEPKYGIRTRADGKAGRTYGGYFEGSGGAGVPVIYGLEAVATGAAPIGYGIYASTDITATSNAYAVYGENNAEAPLNYGVYGFVNNVGGGANTNYGVYGEAIGAVTNWAGYFSGNVRITDFLSFDSGVATDEILAAMPTTPGSQLLTAAAINTAIADSTLWDASGSDIHYTTGRVSINTSTPGEVLNVNGNIEVNNRIRGTANNDHYIQFNPSDLVVFQNNASALNFSASDVLVNEDQIDRNFRVLSQANPDAFRVDGNNGRVSIGTTNAFYPLYVIDDVVLTTARVENEYAGTGNKTAFWAESTEDGTGFSTAIVANARETATGTQGARAVIARVYDNNSSGTSYLYAGSYLSGTSPGGARYGLYLTGEDDNYFSGNVGIGNFSPTSALDVSGRMNVSGSSGAYVATIENSTGYGLEVDIQGSSYAGTFRRNGDGGNAIVLIDENGTGSSGELMRMDNAGNGEFIIMRDASNSVLARFENTGNLHLLGTAQLKIGSAEWMEDGGFSTLQVNSNFIPSSDNNRTLGASGNRWSEIHAGNGIIQTSDENDKTDIEPLSYGLQELMQIETRRFRWKDRPERGYYIGFMAQNLQEVIPEVVVSEEWVQDEATGEWQKRPTERLGVYYSHMIPVLVNAIKEQQSQIEELRQELAALRNNR